MLGSRVGRDHPVPPGIPLGTGCDCEFGQVETVGEQKKEILVMLHHQLTDGMPVALIEVIHAEVLP